MKAVCSWTEKGVMIQIAGSQRAFPNVLWLIQLIRTLKEKLFPIITLTVAA